MLRFLLLLAAAAAGSTQLVPAADHEHRKAGCAHWAWSKMLTDAAFCCFMYVWKSLGNVGFRLVLWQCKLANMDI